LVEKKPMLAPKKRLLGRPPALGERSTRAPRLLAGSTSLPAKGVETLMEALKLEVDANLALVSPRFRIATKPVKIHQESGLQNRKVSLVRFTEQHRKECRNLQLPGELPEVVSASKRRKNSATA